MFLRRTVSELHELLDIVPLYGHKVSITTIWVHVLTEPNRYTTELIVSKCCIKHGWYVMHVCRQVVSP